MEKSVGKAPITSLSHFDLWRNLSRLESSAWFLELGDSRLRGNDGMGSSKVPN